MTSKFIAVLERLALVEQSSSEDDAYDADSSDMNEIIHDIRASANSFSMLVESIENELKNSPHERDHRKVTQLKVHVERNKQVAEAVIRAIEKSPFNPELP